MNFIYNQQSPIKEPLPFALSERESLVQKAIYHACMNIIPLTFVIGKSWHFVCVFFHILHRQYISALPSTANINIKSITTTGMCIQVDPEEGAMN